MSRLGLFYRSVLLQIILVGLVSFSQPGIWNALNGLGAGGEEEPYLVNTANALTYGIMIFGCTLAGGVVNKIGAKWTLVIGVIFYTPYASSLYCNNRFGNEWYVIFGAALCGIGASLFWASEAYIAVGYPSEAQRGRLIGIWMGLRSSAPIIAGAISVSLNIGRSTAGKVSPDTYLALIGIQCIGLPLALLLSPESKVRRPDGTGVPHLRRTTVKEEIKGIWHTMRLPHVVLLIPIFVMGEWGGVSQGNYLTKYFSVRSRALAQLLTAIISVIADLSVGFVADTRWLGNQRQRARFLWAFFAIFTSALWIWQTITQVRFSRDPTPVDYKGSSGRFNSAFAVYLLWKFAYEGQVVFLYWLIGTYPIAKGTLPRAVGVLRTYESVGSCFSFIVGATHWPNLNQSLLSLALWLVCILPTTLAINKVPSERIEKLDETEGARETDIVPTLQRDQEKGSLQDEVRDKVHDKNLLASDDSV
ncbi:duf895 domain protein membrane protein [Acaromyces ingoldii]|uniref:Duf895 domain protein membrane protein n=1 Tax=Acaromyces ingoldii TaxID=215250 RepID=A0A316YC39_9BASI|nr:duf895 domain protein membrane protein [Acaromyces ingoldii]PWN86791.1 duf895 domain protein membrane protein [Acaromyces ingoldii]